MLHQLLLVVECVLEAEEDAADHPDDQHHADDYERGRHSQEYQRDVFVPEREYLWWLKVFFDWVFRTIFTTLGPLLNSEAFGTDMLIC